MSKRTQVYQLFPWIGGVVTSIDESLLQDGQLTKLDNAIMDTRGSKKKREGINEDWDSFALNVMSRSSSGTTRTLDAYDTGALLVTGDNVTILAPALGSYEQNPATLTSVSTLTVTATSSGGLVTEGTDTININSHGLVNGRWIRYVAVTPIGGLVSEQGYFVVGAATNTFQLSLTPGGSAVNLTSDGTGTQTFTGTRIVYTGTGSLTEAVTATTGITITDLANSVGGWDFWFGDESKTQYKMLVNSDGKVMYFNSSGQRARVTDGGTAWTLPLQDATFLTFNNVLLIANSVAGNKVKQWDGIPANPLVDAGLTVTATSSAGLVTEGTDTINITGHGLENARLIRYTASSPIGGLTSGADYYVVGATTNTFQLSLTPAGAAIDLTSDGSGTQTFFGTMPEASIMQTHLERVWCNDKNDIDRLHYSAPFDQTTWGGAGDSGAIDIGPGDGDPGGIIAIFPSFKGSLFVAKRSKLYRVTGFTPDDFQVELVSNGIGCASHRAVATVDQDDVFFVSDKGVHSLAATQAFGSFASAYISQDIQKTINEDWVKSRFKYIQAAYVPEINSVAFAVSENSSASNDSVWFFNVALKAWFRWPDIDCEVLFASQDIDRRRLYFGTLFSRMSQSFTGLNYDIDADGTHVGIQFVAVTGLIYLDKTPYTVKGYKRFSLIYRPIGEHTVLVNFKIDNYPTQALSFTQTDSSDLLGISFVLGESILGYDVVMAPYNQQVDGYGRGVKITLSQTGINEEIEIQGIAIEYEVMGDSQETQGREDTG